MGGSGVRFSDCGVEGGGEESSGAILSAVTGGGDAAGGMLGEEMPGPLTFIFTDVPGGEGAVSSMEFAGNAFGLTVTFMSAPKSAGSSSSVEPSAFFIDSLPPSFEKRRSMRSKSFLPSGGSSACSSSLRSRISSTGMPIDCASMLLRDSRSCFWMEPELRSCSSISTERAIAFPPPAPSLSPFITSTICFWITSCISFCPVFSLIFSNGRSCSTASRPTVPAASSSSPSPMVARSSGAAKARQFL
mmetsp:Transcript_22242/g.55359  ORF Transcript_22242/g.55359 Transcript_22242/m.55359 type:complete len:246 (+) Transcript_22242:991-1728(+)